jgi:hypothetical protein
MGHRLNSTLQDILVRWKRIVGFDTRWVLETGLIRLANGRASLAVLLCVAGQREGE